MAGRIPQDFIDDLLNRTDIADVVEERMTLKRTGRNYSGLCPFHQEKSPSFSVNPEKQFYYCFGCGAGGNAIGFVMEYDRMEFPQAVETLARRVGLDVPQDESRKPANPKLKQAYSLLEQSAQFYEQQLRQHSQRDKAVEYLKGRGLSGQIAKRFKLGYAPPGWDNLIKHLAEHHQNKPSPKTLDDAGLVIYKAEEDKCYDRFRDRIIFPIIDARGRVIAFGGRVLTDEKPKYLNSPETDTFHKSRELYGLYQARQVNRHLETILIVEGYMDVVALAQFDINNAVATLGTATSEHHLTRLFKIVPEVVFCFDGDNAGRTAAKRALETALALMEDGREARFLFLPDGEDPDSLVRKEGHESFNQRVHQATPLSTFFFDCYSNNLDLNSGEGRARLSAAAIPKINTIPGQVFQQLMRQQLAELTGLKNEFVDQLSTTADPANANTNASYNSGASYSATNSNPNITPSNTVYSSNYPSAEDSYGAEPFGAEGHDDYQQPSYYGTPTSHNQNFSNNSTFRPRSFRPQQRLRLSSLGQRAIKALLHAPSSALKVDLETSDILSQLNEPELFLLKALLEQIQQSPKDNNSPAVIVSGWSGDPNFETLRELAEEELLFDDKQQLEQEFIGCIHRLVRIAEESKLDFYLKKRKSTPLTVDELQQVTKLTKLLARNRTSS